MEKIIIGKVTSAVGLKGEVKVYNYSDDSKRFERLEKVYLGDEKNNSPYDITNVRYKDHMVILKFKNIDNRDAAEGIRDTLVFITEDDLDDLPEGVFYIRDMIGMEVFSEEGIKLGILKDVNTNVPQKLYVVEREKDADGNQKADILIPGVDEFIIKIDGDKRAITVKVIEGLYED